MNIWIAVVGILYAVAETRHFGWNLRPMSGDEVIADGIALVLICMAFVGRREK